MKIDKTRLRAIERIADQEMGKSRQSWERRNDVVRTLQESRTELQRLEAIHRGSRQALTDPTERPAQIVELEQEIADLEERLAAAVDENEDAHWRASAAGTLRDACRKFIEGARS